MHLKVLLPSGQGAHAIVPRSCELFDKQNKKYLNQFQKAFLVRWLPSLNIWCTNCTAIGTLGTYEL